MQSFLKPYPIYTILTTACSQVKLLYREHAGALNSWKVEKGMLEKKVGWEAGGCRGVL